MNHASTLRALIGLLFAAGTAAAQCPDGTPLPCDSRRPAPLTSLPKRVNPPLDDATWIVLPFSNVTRSAETEWLSDASVSLLSMDLSRWQDIHVIDHLRVADFMREMPRTAKLSLNDGITVAKRAGAGKLVIGDVLKVGGRTTVTATVYAVRDGKPIRSARQEATVADSLMPMFTRLARALLAVTSGETNVSAVGTTRSDALKEYIGGVTALNRFDVPTAKRHLEAALKLDSAFALAHYQLAIAADYDPDALRTFMSEVRQPPPAGSPRFQVIEDPSRLPHALAAARLSGSLPAREKKLVEGLAAYVTREFSRACEAYASLVRRDSSDVEALYGYGRCLWMDNLVMPAGPGEPGRMRFRTSWNSAIHVFRRLLAIDPGFHLAFDPIVSMLGAVQRIGCVRREAIETCYDNTVTAVYRGVVNIDGDSLVIIPQGPFRGFMEATIANTALIVPRANLEAARRAASDWVAAAPSEGQAKKRLASLWMRLGRPAEAERALDGAMTDRALRNDVDIFLMRLEIAFKLFRGTEVNRLLDSLPAVFGPVNGGLRRASFGPAVGRFKHQDSVARANASRATSRRTQVLAALGIQARRVLAGVVSDSFAATEREAIALLAPPGQPCDSQCVRLLAPGFAFGLRVPRKWPTMTEAAASDPRLLPAVALSLNDTARLRRAAETLDSISRNMALLGTPEDGTSAVAADVHLILGDSAAALATVRRMMDSTLMTSTTQRPLSFGGTAPGSFTTLGLWPRVLLLRADLEATVAGGNRALARELYGKFLDLWMNADPEFAPLLARVRAARAKLAAP